MIDELILELNAGNFEGRTPRCTAHDSAVEIKKSAQVMLLGLGVGSVADFHSKTGKAEEILSDRSRQGSASAFWALSVLYLEHAIENLGSFYFSVGDDQVFELRDPKISAFAASYLSITGAALFTSSQCRNKWESMLVAKHAASTQEEEFAQLEKELRSRQAKKAVEARHAGSREVKRAYALLIRNHSGRFTSVRQMAKHFLPEVNRLREEHSMPSISDDGGFAQAYTWARQLCDEFPELKIEKVK